MKDLPLNLARTGFRLLLLGATLTLASPPAFSQALQGQTPQRGQVPTGQGGQGWAAQQRSQAWATQKLDNSPRRKEWVTIPNGSRPLKARVIYPEMKNKVPVVIVLHEVFGLTDSTTNTADEIAAMGYIAIVPDMLSGLGPNGGDVSSFEGSNKASATLTALPDETVNSALNAIADYGDKLPGANGKFAIVGLSWGGGASFRFAAATQRKDLKAIFVFYDIGPPQETQGPTRDLALPSISVARISAPVYGFYGSTDTRPLATLQATKDAMAAAGKKYDPVVYDGADHAYMRVGEEPNATPANAAAVQASLARLKTLLKDTFE